VISNSGWVITVQNVKSLVRGGQNE